MLLQLLANAVAWVSCLPLCGFVLFACLCVVQRHRARLLGISTAESPPQCPLKCRMDGLRTTGLLELSVHSCLKDLPEKNR